jgi:hypothetical protein
MGSPNKRSLKSPKPDNKAMDEDNNPDLNLIQLEENFEAQKETSWACFDNKYGWTFYDWVEMTQNWKDISKAMKDKFPLGQHSLFSWEHAQQGWILPQVQNECRCPRRRWAASLIDNI